MDENTTPDVPKTLQELRAEFGADSIEYYRQKASELQAELDIAQQTIRNHENWHEVLNQKIKNFDKAIQDIAEEHDGPDDMVPWKDLERALEYLDIEVGRRWVAEFTVKYYLYVKARSESDAENKLDDIWTGDFEMASRPSVELEDWCVDDVDFKDLKRYGE